MRVFITGGTGSIGSRLIARLLERGDRPVVLSRQAAKARLRAGWGGVEVVQGDPTAPGGWEASLEGCDAVVNLVGHNLFADRWTPEIKRKIRDSRVYGTENLVAAIARTPSRPSVLVSGSAIGYYGPTGDEELTEASPSGTDYMAVVCREWEEAARPAEALGSRLAIVRTGVVLAPGEGAIGVMTPIFKWLPGGAAPVGSGSNPLMPGRGKQWMSWIHLDDIVGIFLLAIDDPEARGPINGTAPKPERNVDFSRALAKAVHRPFLPIGPPDVMLGTVLGEIAQVVTKGQRVLPAVAHRLGYSFKFSELSTALADLFPRSAKAAADPKAKGKVAAEV